MTDNAVGTPSAQLMRQAADVEHSHHVGAIVGKGGSPRFVGAAEAFADITGNL